jgi:hypothetical protein
MAEFFAGEVPSAGKMNINTGATRIGGRWKSNSAQSLPTGANKILFPTVSIAAVGITVAGDNTFTIGSGNDGLFTITFCANIATNVSWYIAIGGTVYSNSGNYVMDMVSSGASLIEVASQGITLPFVAGDNICCYVYNNSAPTATINNANRPAQLDIWRTGA